jgi:hypothetical protein
MYNNRIAKSRYLVLALILGVIIGFYCNLKPNAVLYLSKIGKNNYQKNKNCFVIKI